MYVHQVRSKSTNDSAEKKAVLPRRGEVLNRVQQAVGRDDHFAPAQQRLVASTIAAVTSAQSLGQGARRAVGRGERQITIVV